jgi:vesicle-fusing ATPase
MLLYGPPGCGKTLIARKISQALKARPPKIVNGPSILNKYVGGSEEKIRELFADAEAEQEEEGEASELHVIIFDEIDAICKKRGSVSDGTGVHDSVVNQLLTKIDGVDSLDNILVIGMTNRLDMIDDALTRPGRLEVKVEIGLPDEEGRVQILNIHTGGMSASNRLAGDVNTSHLAKKCKNYTGAEIEGLVRSAGQFAMSRAVDITDLSKTLDTSQIRVEQKDFVRAIAETTPAFGALDDVLSLYVPNGIISFGQGSEELQATAALAVTQVRNVSPILSLLFHGPQGCGKSAFTAQMAIDSGYPFIRRLGGDSKGMLGCSERQRQATIRETFEAAYRSPLSMIILDDLERILGYVPIGPQFSNTVLQTLLILIKARPPPGRRLLVVATTSRSRSLEALELTQAFQMRASMPELCSVGEVKGVVSSWADRKGIEITDDVATAFAGHFGEETSIPMKRLLRILEGALSAAAGTGDAADVTSLEIHHLQDTLLANR